MTFLRPLQLIKLTICSAAPVAKIRVDNLHYDLTEDDLEVHTVLPSSSTTH